MLLELAVGDAYGAGFEYAPNHLLREHNDATHYIRHPRHSIAPGCYTDDTQMSLAIAEALLSGEPWTPQLLAEHFVTAFHRDPRTGYSGRFYEFLQEIRSGEDFLARIHNDSDKSGAAMRAAPLGVLPTADEVIERCRVQAAVTHNTPDGIAAACAAALMTHYCLYRLGPKRGIGKFLNRYVAGHDWSALWEGKVGAKGWMSVRAAITAVMRNSRMDELLVACVAFTGDVDTVASIACAAASCCDEYEPGVPESLRAALENGKYGRDYLVDVDRRLMALASRPAAS